MKKMKKYFALFVALAMVLGMSVMSFGASITVNRDSTYSGTDNGAGRAYTYSQIFHATLSAANESTNTPPGYNSDGTPGDVTASLQKGYSYYLKSSDDATQIGQLGTWVAAADDDDPATTDVDESKAHWEKKSGNLWFDLTPSADGSQYIVSWANGVATNTDTAQAAAKWLAGKTNNAANYTPLKTGDLTFANGKWTASNLEDGYYLISGDTGNNLVAATGDININEKNDYPPLTKEQKDENSTTYVGEDGEPLDVAIGDVINYKVTVSIPKTAKAGETIEVWDKASSGLTYNNDVVANPATNVANGTLGSGEAWHKIITVTADNKGTNVVFTYSMTINDDALVDTGRKNEAKLKYGNNYESLPHSVEYTTYFTGVHKTDGDDANKKMAGVKFELKEGGKYFPVKKTGSYYIPDTSIVKGENETDEAFEARAKAASVVVTDDNGYIYIRGLDNNDNNKIYTLTETETLDGYNMLKEDVTLVLVEDKGNAFTNYSADSYQDVVNYKGAELPDTGGIGTTIFYVLGTILVLAAGVLLVTRRRMRHSEE